MRFHSFPTLHLRQDKISRELQDVFESVFGKAIPRITNASTSKDITNWDSLTHLNLIIAIEERFNTRFTTAEIRGFKAVGDLVNLLKARSMLKGTK